MSDQPVQPTPETPTPTEAAKTGRVFTEQELETIIKDRLARAQAKEAKAIADATAKAEAEAAAKQGEFEKQAKLFKAKADEYEALLKQRDLAERKRAIGVKLGLPEALAARLQGETDEEIEKDAKALLDTLPKPARPQPGPVNPGVGGSTAPTLQERLARLHGQQSDPFDLAMLKAKNGGVFMTEKEQ